MSDIANRFSQNPILLPCNIAPSRPDLEVVCLLNPGAFQFDGKIWLILRVAENAKPKHGYHRYPYIDQKNSIQLMETPVNHPDLNTTDARVHRFKGKDYLTTLSHLRLVYSEDGIHFKESADFPPIGGILPLETYGIEDCRVVQISNIYYLTYTAVSEYGVGVAMRSTSNWKEFTCHGLIFPPHNKDCALFPERINGKFYAFHRPSSVHIGGNYIWMAESVDRIHWGNHRCVLTTRENKWDSVRVGAGAAPIRTELGWLEIYHGANENNQYCLGAILMDLENPFILIGRTDAPIMIPTETYETTGFFGNVVFSNGHVLSADGDTLTIYYGAADTCICGATCSVKEIISHMQIY